MLADFEFAGSSAESECPLLAHSCHWNGCAP